MALSDGHVAVCWDVEIYVAVIGSDGLGELQLHVYMHLQERKRIYLCSPTDARFFHAVKSFLPKLTLSWLLLGGVGGFYFLTKP